MKTYRLNISRYTRSIIPVFAVSMVMVIGSLAIMDVLSNYHDPDSSTLFKDNLPVAIIVLAAAGVMAMVNMIKTAKSYSLTVDNDSFVLNRINHPTLSLQKKNIGQIIRNKNGSYVLKSVDKKTIIDIPCTIDNKSEIDDLLSNIGLAFTPGISRIIRNVTIAIAASILTIILFDIFFYSKTAWVVTSVGAIIITGLIITAIVMRKSNLVNKKSEKTSLLCSIGVIVFIIIKIIAVFTK